MTTTPTTTFFTYLKVILVIAFTAALIFQAVTPSYAIGVDTCLHNKAVTTHKTLAIPDIDAMNL